MPPVEPTGFGPDRIGLLFEVTGVRPDRTMATGLRPGGTPRPAKEPPTAAGFGAAPVGLTGTGITGAAGFGKFVGNGGGAPNATELPKAREVTTTKLTLDSM